MWRIYCTENGHTIGFDIEHIQYDYVPISNGDKDLHHWAEVKDQFNTLKIRHALGCTIFCLRRMAREGWMLGKAINCCYYHYNKSCIGLENCGFQSVVKYINIRKDESLWDLDGH